MDKFREYVFLAIVFVAGMNAGAALVLEEPSYLMAAGLLLAVAAQIPRTGSRTGSGSRTRGQG